MAIHGGGIEPGTTEIAEALAGKMQSFYSFSGLKPSGNRRLHLSSRKFDEPIGIAIAQEVHTIVTLHFPIRHREETKKMWPQMKRILYATDLSPNSGYALRYALDAAKKNGARLLVLHVIEELPPTALALTESFLSNGMIMNISKDKKSLAKERILKRLQSICRNELKTDPEAERLITSIEIVEGHPADQILKNVDALDCDAIFMGTHGKGFLSHPYFGSTSKRVIRRVRKPVFIVPLPEGDTDITIHDE